MHKRADYPILPGAVIQGKWHHKKYTIVRELGKGTVGTVYLCKREGKFFALKLSAMPMSISREVAVLRRLNKVRDKHLGPFLFDVDDWEQTNRAVHAFYVMEYIHGKPLERLIQQKRTDQVSALLIKLLDKLELLHEEGLIFGDLKKEHIRITPPMNLKFLDVGGMTKIGQSVKEYSNFYDRAYWQLGSRKAEPSYDLFAVVMIFVSIYYPQQFQRTRDSKTQIMRHIQRHPVLKKYQVPFHKAIVGTYPSARNMKQDIVKLTMRQSNFNKKGKLLPQAFIISILSGLYYFISVYFF